MLLDFLNRKRPEKLLLLSAKTQRKCTKLAAAPSIKQHVNEQNSLITAALCYRRGLGGAESLPTVKCERFKEPIGGGTFLAEERYQLCLKNKTSFCPRETGMQ